MKCDLCRCEIPLEQYFKVEASGLGDYHLCIFCFERLNEEEINDDDKLA